MRRYTTWILMLTLVVVFSTIASHAQEPLAPSEIQGEAVYIPFNVPITLDGDLSDWAGVPVTTVDRGSMRSLNPAENGSFDFAVAADGETFYIYMTMRDQNIVTGQHGSSYWNEDSLEFYLNLSGDLMAQSYGDGIFQININPSDIGKTDLDALTITGSGSSGADVQGIVFKTDDGWGFEASVAIGAYVTPAHGLEIGFQAQANGATSFDRDVKLIWSLADIADNSYQDPRLFGSGIFFEVGQTEIPLPTPRAEAGEEVVVRQVSINQVGYFPNAPKIAVLASEGTSRRTWSLLDAETGEMLTAGITGAPYVDEASGDTIHTIDFTSFTTPGTYRLLVDGVMSPDFVIGNDIYSQLKVDALRYFYLNRAGIELTTEYAGEWARPAGHLTDNNVTCYQGTDADGNEWAGCDYTLDAAKGWYDAGDYGKYVVNGGITVWTLQNLYERFPSEFADGTLAIPESQNGIPDILDETRWEMEFLLSMQVPEGYPLAGMAHHKLHDREWSAVPSMPPTEYDNDNGHTNPSSGRYLYAPTTAATLNLAASAAQCARIWESFDAEFAARCRAAAERAWAAANENSALLAGRTPGSGGGDYGDSTVSDEFFWAAAELYITTGDSAYLDYLKDSIHWSVFPGTLNSNVGSMDWGNTAALGTISLVVAPNGLDASDVDHLRGQIIQAADRFWTQLDGEGYRVPIPSPAGYVWGSSSVVLNNGLVMALAYDFTGDVRYLSGVHETMNYLLGRNALTRSLISGYGAVTMEHPHHRFWGNQPSAGFPAPPPGAVSGGPNTAPSDPAAINAGVEALSPPKRYVDLIGSFSTNEVAINWNAPLVWVVTYLDHVGAP
ncbi:MAG: glycoside hydrolase family 9 protein [Anaerolineales bacterium]|nr:glycoside hydrolase family 9 protein [Anaerolineales bacterium]